MISGPRLEHHHQRWGGGSNSSASFYTVCPHGVGYYSISTNLVGPGANRAIGSHPDRSSSWQTRNLCANPQRLERRDKTPRDEPLPPTLGLETEKSKHSFSALADGGVQLVTLHIQLCKSKWLHECKCDVADQRNSTWMTNKVFVHSNLLQLHVWHR